MLADEYAALDPQRLLQLLATVAGAAFASVNVLPGTARYAPYCETLQSAMETIRHSANTTQAPELQTIDQCQKDLTAAYSKLSRKRKLPDPNIKRLEEVAALLLQVIYYDKTQDPIYIIGIWDEIQHSDAKVLEAYEDQLKLIGRLKTFLRI